MKNQMRVLSLAAAVTVAGCSVKETPKPADTTAAASAPAATAATAPNVVNITASDYKFEGPAEVPAGMTTIHLTNNGKEPHQANLIRLDSGKTYADMIAGMKTMKPDAPPPKWVIMAGGPNAVAPGGSTDLTMNLQPGNYAIVCFVPNAKGVPHVMLGMGQALTVKPNAAASTAEPASDVSVTLSDYKFDFSTPLTAGKHTLKIQNTAAQPHEFTLFKLMPGKTADDITKYFSSDMKAPPPGMPVGGTAGMASGDTVYFPVELQAGDYAVICFLPDAKDGKPHFVHGMTQVIKIT
jgi:hypothetical protein